MKNIKTFNEAFDWEEFDNTDLAGMGWDMRCQELVAEFCHSMEKEMPVGTAQTRDRKDTLRALATLFNNTAREAQGHADMKYCNTEQPEDAHWIKRGRGTKG